MSEWPKGGYRGSEITDETAPEGAAMSEALAGGLQSEGLFSQPRPECPEPWRWHSRDEQGTEDEVSTFLAGFVTALRPHHVLETGAYLGDTTVAIGRALVGYGHLDTVEIVPERAERVRVRVRELPVTVHCMDTRDFDRCEYDFPGYDFAFFDSDAALRVPYEMRTFRKPGAFWALHDAKWQEMQTDLDALFKDGVIEPWLTLPTPRGLAIGRWKVPTPPRAPETAQWRR